MVVSINPTVFGITLNLWYVRPATFQTPNTGPTTITDAMRVGPTAPARDLGCYTRLLLRCSSLFSEVWTTFRRSCIQLVGLAVGRDMKQSRLDAIIGVL